MTALEKTWHTEHFFCAQCGKQFGEDGFHERDGKPYCRDDYFDMFAPKCGGCSRPIMENYISALNSQWHADCFVCRVRCLPPLLFQVVGQSMGTRFVSMFSSHQRTLAKPNGAASDGSIGKTGGGCMLDLSGCLSLGLQASRQGEVVLRHGG